VCADGAVLAQRRTEPTRHLAGWLRLVQGALIFDLLLSPAPAGEVHARSVAGIPQVHHPTAGTGRAGSGPVPGHRRPGYPDPVWPAALGEMTQRTPGRRRRAASRGSGRRPAIRKGAVRCGGSCDHAAGRARESPVVSPAPGEPVTAADGYRNAAARGSVNRVLRLLGPGDPPAVTTRQVHDRGRCPLYVRAQLETAGLRWTQRDYDSP
jgi:hypothetical protein